MSNWLVPRHSPRHSHCGYDRGFSYRRTILANRHCDLNRTRAARMPTLENRTLKTALIVMPTRLLELAPGAFHMPGPAVLLVPGGGRVQSVCQGVQ
jgi:hypothetical protein